MGYGQVPVTGPFSDVGRAVETEISPVVVLYGREQALESETSPVAASVDCEQEFP